VLVLVLSKLCIAMYCNVSGYKYDLWKKKIVSTKRVSIMISKWGGGGGGGEKNFFC